MTYVFDIDGTICTNTDGRYENAQPFTERINFINKLYDEGNKIIFFTARGMNTFQGDIIKVKAAYRDLTEKQLKQWNVKYHYFLLGKPSADLYIDDKGVKDEDFFRASIRH